MKPAGDIHTDIVLIGGGHAHVEVLRAFAMAPLEGVRLSVIARDVLTPYSGMLPGYLAGLYDHDEAHVDLRPLAARAGARLIHAA
ncbi:MAG: bifunctional NADH dehydrogenase FAD-containing subunit/selenide, water dikinase SelD, partial [Proteobacteria bacterium]|nr:bifunctional NADH dehydrogenase FAD-containing subunit/selenide, water dikinase SelD [Pseudomonadota bacterium]